MDILSVCDLSMSFGGLKALQSVNFSVKKNSITSLIGPNGAGKTTAFNCITGFYKPNRGEMLFYSKNGEIDVRRLLGVPFEKKDVLSPRSFFTKLYYKMFGGSHLVTVNGLTRTFQNLCLFQGLTVIENLLVAQHTALNTNIFSGVFQLAPYKNTEKCALEKCFRILTLFGLENKANDLVSSLSYGQAKLTEIARSLCTSPELLCLDEPAAGLNTKETEILGETIEKIRHEFKITVFLIEHDMKMVMDISDYIIVIDHGEVIARGRPQEIKDNPKVIEAYLGEEFVKEKNVQ